MDKNRAAPPENGGGRNFLEAVKDAKYRMGRKEAMQVGDYIDMSSAEFNSWIGDVIQGDPESLKQSDVVRVVVDEIIDPVPANRNVESTKIVAEANGVKKRVDASLFYSYGYRPDHGDIMVTNMSLEDSPRSDGTPSGWK